MKPRLAPILGPSITSSSSVLPLTSLRSRSRMRRSAPEAQEERVVLNPSATNLSLRLFKLCGTHDFATTGIN